MNITEQTQAMAQKVLDSITEHPEQHDQSNFFCGTAKCIAGWALHHAYGISSGTEFWDRFGPEALDNQAAAETYTEMAAPLLGLDDEEAQHLFYEMDETMAVQKLKHVIVGDEEGFWDQPSVLRD